MPVLMLPFCSLLWRLCSFSFQVFSDVAVDLLSLWEEVSTGAPYAAILKCSLQPFWMFILMLDITESNFSYDCFIKRVFF